LGSRGTVTPACPELRRDCALGFLPLRRPTKYLRVPHPGLIRVGSYDRAQQIFRSSSSSSLRTLCSLCPLCKPFSFPAS
jgi:hypothetical protein